MLSETQKKKKGEIRKNIKFAKNIKYSRIREIMENMMFHRRFNIISIDGAL